MPQCQIYVPIENEGSVTYIYNLYAILFSDICQEHEIYFVKYVCLVTGHMVDASDLIYITYMYIHSSICPESYAI